MNYASKLGLANSSQDFLVFSMAKILGFYDFTRLILTKPLNSWLF
jgi:hypothetical protein